MNKRINELMDQSVETRIDIFSNEEYNAFSREKFAELIVKECAELAKLHVMNISTYADAEFVDQQIKEHFGVEE